jgi:hypothetical protein
MAPMWGWLGRCDHQPMARSVLIVDDHAPFGAVAWALLQLEGFAVVGEASLRVRPSSRRGAPGTATS